ncbi:peptidoglycan glycosyltransferase [Calothrix sp. NIES-2098]|nr:peptidoglycan glycosyltransferase [Calothrix sp. NIES-2098]
MFATLLCLIFQLILLTFYAPKFSSTGGYQRGAYITSFLRILPAQSPHYVVLALVDEAQGANADGGTVGAPIVKSAIEALIPVKQIPPSQLFH